MPFRMSMKPRAGYLCGTRSVLPSLIENLAFVRVIESSLMTFTWSGSSRTCR